MSRPAARARATRVPVTPAPAGDPATRRRICEAAIRLIVKGKGGDVSMAAVARAARVSRQAVYLHFTNRSELFLAIAEYADEQRGLRAEVDRVATAPSGIESLERMAALQVRTNPQIWPLARLIDAARRQDPAAEAVWQHGSARRLQGCRTLVARLEQEETLRPGLAPDVAADLLWTLTSLRTWEDLVLTRGWTAAQYEERLTAALQAALLRPGAGDRSRR